LRYERPRSPEVRLDVNGIKIQVFGRIEELEETKVKERGELLTEIVPAMKAMEQDTGAVKAIMNG
jgi:hypothetical protein